MLLKPTEVEFVEILEENDEEEFQSEIDSDVEDILSEDFDGTFEDDSSDTKPPRELYSGIKNYISLKDKKPEEKDTLMNFGPPVLIGGTEDPIFLEGDIEILEDEETYSEEEYVIGEIVEVGGGYQDSYDEESGYQDFQQDQYGGEVDDSLYDFEDQEFNEFEDDFESGILDEISEGQSTEGLKHSTLMGKVDNKLLDKIKEYRENVQDISEEKLQHLSDGDGSRDRLLSEAANLIDEEEQESGMNQMIADLDIKLTTIIEKASEEKTEELKHSRKDMLGDVEQQMENVISEQMEVIRQEAEEHIEATIEYYKKKLEDENQVLSTANNIISRREQILDEAYNKSVQVVEEAEGKSREIIETAALAQDEAERIIAESEQKGDEIRQEAEIEAERIISDANVESSRIIQAAEDQHQDIVDAATQDGFNVGYQEGKEEALKENSQLLKEAVLALDKIHAAFPVAVKQNEEKLLKLAYQISNSMIGEKVTIRENVSDRVLRNATKLVSDLEPVRIKVNPEDLDLILPKQEYIKIAMPDVEEYEILGDEEIMKGACVINTKSSDFNISISTQIPILEEVFNEALSDEENAEMAGY